MSSHGISPGTRVMTRTLVERPGTYEGDYPYPGVGNTDSTTGALRSLFGLAGIPNPKIVCDDGTVLWGCECWWWPIEDKKVTEEAKRNGL